MNGSGEIVDQPIRVANFSSINVQGPFSIELVQSPVYSVVLSTDKNLISRVLITLERKTLKASIEAPATFFPTSLELRISVPEVSSLNFSGGAKASISGFRAIPEFTLYLAEESSLNGDLEATSATFNVTGRSRVVLIGSATRLELEASESSKLDLENLVLTGAQVKLTKSSEATLRVNGRFDVILNDYSKIYYLGNPMISNTTISGGSSMIQK